jgi:beta-lactamase superfamily II metal-dependent hydrolase
MRGFALFSAAVLGLAVAAPAKAQTNDAIVRVVDTGPGLCVVAAIPGGFDLLYDAGHWNGQHCAAAVDQLVTDGQLDLIIISHSDGDHLGQLDTILSRTRATHIIHTGHPGTSNAWRDAMAAIETARLNGTRVTNLATRPLVPGDTLQLGPATVTLVAGWHNWEDSLSTGPLTPAERRNVISIVARLDYGGKSILLTGDTIGRRIGAGVDACDHAERWMVRNMTAALRADVLLAPHHGGDNGGSKCFIEAVQPKHVLFSAGHNHHHPTEAAAARYASLAPIPWRMRTDYGDDEGGNEWRHGRRRGCEDLPGDDDLEIRLPSEASRPLTVRYRSAVRACRSRR